MAEGKLDVSVKAAPLEWVKNGTKPFKYFVFSLPEKHLLPVCFHKTEVGFHLPEQMFFNRLNLLNFPDSVCSYVRNLHPLGKGPETPVNQNGQQGSCIYFCTIPPTSRWLRTHVPSAGASRLAVSMHSHNTWLLCSNLTVKLKVRSFVTAITSLFTLLWVLHL